MLNGMWNKGLVLGIIMLFVGASFIPSISGNVEIIKDISEQNICDNTVNTLSIDTLYVDNEGDGNYKTIQAAIDAANESDTIIVYSGTYVENVIVDKRVNLIGNNTELGAGNDTGKPIVDGNNTGDVIDLAADKIYLSGFKITNSAGLELDTGSYKGIRIRTDFNTITGNEITKNNCHGIGSVGSNNTITNNIISHNKVCGYAQFRKSINNTIVGNTFIRNGIGISPT